MKPTQCDDATRFLLQVSGSSSSAKQSGKRTRLHRIIAEITPKCCIIESI